MRLDSRAKCGIDRPDPVRVIAMQRRARIVDVFARGAVGECKRISSRDAIELHVRQSDLHFALAFESVGGLDESYFYGPEDVDLCLRLREAGFRIVQVQSARCDHPPRRRSRKLWTMRGVRHSRAVIRHLWRHRGFKRRVRE